MDLYFMWDVGYLKMCHPKYCDNQTIDPILWRINQDIDENVQFYQTIGLLPLVSIVSKNYYEGFKVQVGHS